MPVLYAVRQHVGTGAGLAGFGALGSSARVHRFAWFLFGAGFLRNIALYQKFLVTLRTGTAAEENRLRHDPDYQRGAAVRAGDVHFPDTEA